MLLLKELNVLWAVAEEPEGLVKHIVVFNSSNMPRFSIPCRLSTSRELCVISACDAMCSSGFAGNASSFTHSQHNTP